MEELFNLSGVAVIALASYCSALQCLFHYSKTPFNFQMLWTIVDSNIIYFTWADNLFKMHEHSNLMKHNRNEM